MGVHISFVRSVELDSFNPDQMVMMILGGNSKARQFYKGIGIDAKRKENVVRMFFCKEGYFLFWKRFFR